MIMPEFILIASRIIFFLLTFLSINRGDPIGIVLTLTVFLIMEVFIEDLTDINNNK